MGIFNLTSFVAAATFPLSGFLFRTQAAEYYRSDIEPDDGSAGRGRQASSVTRDSLLDNLVANMTIPELGENLTACSPYLRSPIPHPPKYHDNLWY